MAYYRIKQTDIDGNVSYSKVLSTVCKDQISIYPNPTSGDLFIDYDASSQGTHSIVLRDVVGNEILRLHDETIGGHSIVLDGFENLNSGVYMISIINNRGEVIKQEKVIKK